MKRFSPILFIWMACLVGTAFLTYTSYYEGNVGEMIAWMTSSTFAANLIVYHFFATSKQKESSDK